MRGGVNKRPYGSPPSRPVMGILSASPETGPAIHSKPTGTTRVGLHVLVTCIFSTVAKLQRRKTASLVDILLDCLPLSPGLVLHVGAPDSLGALK
jgi:hypothetical protein